MRRPARWVPAVVAGVIVACSSLDNIAVDVTGTAVVERGGPLDELLPALEFLGFGSIQITDSQQFRNQGYTEDDIDSVRLVQLTLTITEPDGASFDFLSAIAFYAEAEGQPRVQIGQLEEGRVRADTTRLEIDVDSTVELRPYVLAETMTITTEASGTRPPQDTTIEAAALFDIDINADGGLCD